MEDEKCYVMCKMLRKVEEQRDEMKDKYEMSRDCSNFSCGCGMVLGAVACFIGIFIARLMQ
ncbi:hypothetical protein SAMN05720470_10831 [Fibrobacter sp. UWOV1]|nr:hypothetical protein SAMN05720470_10831 [Fibrobacter sp. UWOV1]